MVAVWDPVLLLLDPIEGESSRLTVDEETPKEEMLAAKRFLVVPSNEKASIPIIIAKYRNKRVLYLIYDPFFVFYVNPLNITNITRFFVVV
jgi:hypothetical protein